MQMDHPFSSRDIAKGIFFRFLFSYLVLYIVPFPLYFIPFSNYVVAPIGTLFATVTDTVGPWLLGKQYYHPDIVTGSGDSSFKYTQSFIFLILAAIATVVWYVIDRKRFDYKKLDVLLNTLVRYYLAATLLGYGFQKVIPLQFPAPTAARMAQTYGESSPMGLLWTFMGSSAMYTRFTGIGEVLAGSLLLFRRTTLLGALISTFIMLHIFVLNLSYDVPVKLFSLHLFLMAVFLMAPNTHRLAGLFILNRTVSPEEQVVIINNRKLRWLRTGIKVVVVCLLFFQPLLHAIEQGQSRKADTETASGIRGKYEVVDFILNSDTLGGTEKQQWKEILVRGNSIEITYKDEFSTSWHCSTRYGLRTIKVVSKDLSTSGIFTFKQDADTLSLRGLLNQDSIRIISRRTAEDKFLLLDRGFHWISEEPFYH